MKTRHWPLWPLLLLACRSAPAAGPPEGPCVVLVTADGLRWQEVFGGADEKLMTKEAGVRDLARLKRDFWRETPEERRKALLPFFWDVMAREGQIYGNVERGSPARLTNGKKFSYPGYQEILGGFPDPAINSNEKKPNPNPNVLEWLNGRPGFGGRVAAFCTWDVFPFILNAGRSKIPVVSGWETLREPALRAGAPVFGEIPRVWEDNCWDALTFHAAMDHLGTRRPRVLYVAFGETDEWAHAGRYDLYLRAARQFDAYLKQLWETLQSMPEYRGRTSLVITTDHGRGSAPVEWKNHGGKVEGAEFIWIAALGPRTPALGERANFPEVTQAQVAATVAALVGEDYAAAVPRAARPIADVVR